MNKGVGHEYFNDWSNFCPLAALLFSTPVLMATAFGNCILANCTDDYLGFYLGSFFQFQPGIDCGRNSYFCGIGLGLALSFPH
jgi:hypothetical protein